MGLTVYLRFYPQACPLGVCNPQLDTFITIKRIVVDILTDSESQAIESGGLVIA